MVRIISANALLTFIKLQSVMTIRPVPFFNLRLSGIGIAVGYFMLASLSLRFTRYDGGAAFVWAAGALLFAGLTVAPRRHRLSVAFWSLPAMALSGALFGLGWKVAGPLALANVGEAYAAAWLVRRTFPRFGQFRSAKEIFWFVLVAGLMVPCLVAFIGALFVNLVAHAPYWAIWRDWFTAHAVGMIAFGPPLTLIFGGHMKRWAVDASLRRSLEAGGIMAAVIAVALMTFGQSKVPLLAAPFLPMMLATLYLGRFGAVASIVILIAIGSSCSLAGIGPTTMIHGGMGLRLQVLQLYFATVVLVILPTAGELIARRRVFERLSQAEALNRLMLDHSSDIIIRLGIGGAIQYVSPSIGRYDGVVPGELIGQRLDALVHPNDRDGVVAAHRAAVAASDQSVPIEWQAHEAVDPPRWFEAHARAIIGKSGEATGVVYVIRDVTERNLRAIELEVRANTDPLTGLVNRRVFDQALDAAIATSVQTHASLAIFDLDHFKSVNDRHGHASGDRVLKKFAEVVRACTREGDITARLGGEEFALILRDAADEEAAMICERIRSSFARITILAGAGTPFTVTVSAGLKQVHPGATAVSLMEEADRALYEAKRAGRNRLAFAA